MSSKKAAASSEIHPLIVGLFGLSLTELILGGGGRWFDWGFLTPRMMLFGACQLTWIISWASGRFHPGTRVLALTLIPLGATIFASGIGLLNAASVSSVFTDVKPLLYVLNLPFYALILRDPLGRRVAGLLFRWLGLAMAIGYLAFWILWQTDWVDGWAFYQSTEQMGEFFFRGNMGFFYKGFVFLPVALFFWEKVQFQRKRWVQVLIYAAILLTFTRAIWLILLFFPLRSLWNCRGHNPTAWLALMLMLVGPWLVEKGVVDTRHEREFLELKVKDDPYPNQKYLEQYPYPDWQQTIAFAFSQSIMNRHLSMMERFVQIDEVGQRIGPLSLLFGHGLGIGTPLKPVHMEISYLEIFHKQGLLGLGIWGLLLFAAWVQFRRSTSMPYADQSLSTALLHSVFFVAALSFFNPFINAPMGLALLTMGLALPHHFKSKHGPEVVDQYHAGIHHSSSSTVSTRLNEDDRGRFFEHSSTNLNTTSTTAVNSLERHSQLIANSDPSTLQVRPRVSVCMSTYNGSRWLREQIESILPQLQKGDDLCVADDGSTDGTLEILQEYIDHGHPIQVYPAGGHPLHHPSYNLERALRQAKSEYIFLSDQDDVWLPGKVDGICRALQNHTLVIHDARVTDEVLTITSPSFFELHRTKTGAIENFVRNSYLGCCMAFRKSLLEKALPFPPQLAMHDIWLGNVAALWFDTHFSHEIYVLYRRHSGTVSTTAAASGYTLWQQIALRGRLARQIGRNLLRKS
ncbi:MAG: glycosyltransferase family 2 protein [Sphingomonadales bacterium]|nr:glycosyltransferase family 2 protein [Sphingomonadales bacterium]